MGMREKLSEIMSKLKYCTCAPVTMAVVREPFFPRTSWNVGVPAAGFLTAGVSGTCLVASTQSRPMFSSAGVDGTEPEIGVACRHESESDRIASTNQRPIRMGHDAKYLTRRAWNDTGPRNR